jgi:spermidine/putrescine-binding protein
MSFDNSMTGCALSWRASKARVGAVAFAGLALPRGGLRRARHPAAPGAGEEPVLHIYNWADYIGHGTIAEFERKTHIKVIYELYDSNATLEAKMLAGSSGYDIVSTTTGFYGRQIKAGAYQPLDKSKLPNWKNLDPAVLAVQSQADPGNRYAVPYLHAMNGFAYNVDHGEGAHAGCAHRQPGHAVRSQGDRALRGLRRDVPGFFGRRHPTGAGLPAPRPQFAQCRGLARRRSRW